MATKGKDESATKQKSGKGKLLVIIVVLLVLLLAAGGGAAWWFLIHKKPAAAAAGKAVAAAAQPAHFIHLQPFVTNVQSSDGQAHYLQVKIDLKTTDESVESKINQLMPEIRSSILDLLAAQQASTVTLDTTRAKLRVAIQAKVNHILVAAGASGAGGGPISGVYFSGFVMQ